MYVPSLASSIVTNSHQEAVSGRACNPPDLHWFSTSSLVGEFYRYSEPKWLLLLH
jgi:hypothetical protein